MPRPPAPGKPLPSRPCGSPSPVPRAGGGPRLHFVPGAVGQKFMSRRLGFRVYCGSCFLNFQIQGSLGHCFIGTLRSRIIGTNVTPRTICKEPPQHRQTDRQTDGQTDRQTERRTDGLTDRQAERRINRETHLCSCLIAVFLGRVTDLLPCK